MSNSIEDVLLWPCGTWCFRHESSEFQHLSDDYEVLPFGSERWTRTVETDPVQRARVGGYGYLSAQCCDRRPLQVLKSAAGYYLGTLTEEGFPNTRESTRYWPSQEAAESAKASGEWEQRMYL